METKETKEKLIGPTVMTKFEKARILGLRAQQIDMNAQIMVDPKGEDDSLRLALMELRERKIPFIIRRTLPDGTFQDVSINDLIIP